MYAINCNQFINILCGKEDVFYPALLGVIRTSWFKLVSKWWCSSIYFLMSLLSWARSFLYCSLDPLFPQRPSTTNLAFWVISFLFEHLSPKRSWQFWHKWGLHFQYRLNHHCFVENYWWISMPISWHLQHRKADFFRTSRTYVFRKGTYVIF